MMKCRLSVLGVFVAAMLSGCSRDKTADAVAEVNKSNIQRLGNAYAAHQNFQNGRGPKDEAEFKKFLSEFDPNKLKMMGINKDNLDGVFTSERDGQKFQIRYGVGGGRGSVDAVIFEKAGANGTKQVAFTSGEVQDADETTYKDLWAGKKPANSAGPAGPPTGAPPGGGGRPGGGGPPPGAPTGPKG